MGVTLHVPGPAQETPEVVALAPHEFPKFYKTNLLHLDAGVGFNPPKKVRATPRSQVMATGGVPEEADLLHGAIISKGTPFDYVTAGSGLPELKSPDLQNRSGRLRPFYSQSRPTGTPNRMSGSFSVLEFRHRSYLFLP